MVRQSRFGASRMKNLKKAPEAPVDKTMLDGNVFLTGKMLLNTLRAVHPCCKENSECLQVKDNPEMKQGHFRCLKVLCSKCDLDIYVDEDPQRDSFSFREHKLDNRRFAFGADCVGLDFESLKLLCSLLDIPGPPDSYDYLHQSEIHEALKKQIQKKLKENREESWELHPKDEEGIAMVAVKTDGTYQKRGDTRRGYNSKVGIVLLCDGITNKFLDYVILNKYCHQCTQQKKVLSEERFEAWFTNHECSANFEGASSEMERNAVRKMFECSLEYKLRYKWMVGDGDTKSYLDVWDVYGCCDSCQKWKHLLTKRNSKEYEEWSKTKDFTDWQDVHGPDSKCKVVMKMDCIQHVGKCFRNKLEDICKVGAKAPDGLSVFRGNNRLGPGARAKLQQYFKNACRAVVVA